MNRRERHKAAMRISKNFGGSRLFRGRSKRSWVKGRYVLVGKEQPVPMLFFSVVQDPANWDYVDESSVMPQTAKPG